MDRNTIGNEIEEINSSHMDKNLIITMMSLSLGSFVEKGIVLHMVKYSLSRV